ncbi:MAG: divergent polysaccharide deacetylase family protein [Alphaproteobacteria bacterium]
MKLALPALPGLGFLRARRVPLGALALALVLLATLHAVVPRRGPGGEIARLSISEEEIERALEEAEAAEEARQAASRGGGQGGGDAAGAAILGIDAEWEKRSVPTTLLQGRRYVSIVIDDLGLDRPRAMRAIGLPTPVTLSFLPYGRDAPALAVLARQRGHEILLHMPMQAVGGESPGPHALTVDLAAVEVRGRVGAALDRFGDAVGLNNHMGSRFTADRRLLVPVMEELRARGLVFVDSRTAAESQGSEAAGMAGVPTATRDVFLDNEATPEAISRQLRELERLARRRGHAVGIAHPHDATFAALAAWLPGLQEKGLQAVPVTTIIRRNLDRARAAQ